MVSRKIEKNETPKDTKFTIQCVEIITRTFDSRPSMCTIDVTSADEPITFGHFARARTPFGTQLRHRTKNNEAHGREKMTMMAMNCVQCFS